jgi:hypothetical protein
MEPLPAATLAGLTPRDIEVRFYDDRMEVIPFDEPTDLVAISVETYTAKRAYQIASEYRRRGVPVVMGGFHATLCPDEVARYAEAVVCGEAEQLWPRCSTMPGTARLQKFYRASGRPLLAGMRPDRSIFRGKRYLPIGLVEAGRGCHFKCDFCAVQTVFDATQTRRPIDQILAEIPIALKDRRSSSSSSTTTSPRILAQAKEFFRALIPLRLRWVSQASINAAHDEEFLDLLVRSGCQGVLIGFESLEPANLAAMNKTFNTAGAASSRRWPTCAATASASTAPSSSATTATRRRASLPRSPSPASTPSTSPPSTTSRRSRARRCTSRLEAEGRLLLRRLVARRALQLQPHSLHPRRPERPRSCSAGCLTARRARSTPGRASCAAASTR